MILSTFHEGEEEVKVEVNVSEAVDDYNKNQGGVNQCDQMLTVSPTEGLRTEVW